jgi:hypothetical protein
VSLRNYTTSVPVDRSVAKIADLLVAHGATHIQHTYAEKVKETKFEQLQLR